jgi:hypothetical protein
MAPAMFSIAIAGGILYHSKNLRTFYRQYSADAPAKPADQKLQEIIGLLNRITKANTKTNQDIIEFWVNKTGSKSGNSIYRAKLEESSAIVIAKDGSNVTFVQPDEFVVVNENGQLTMINGLCKIEIQIKNAKYGGFINPMFIERYDNWKKTT